MNNLHELSTLLSSWLSGMTLVSMTYAAGFTARFEREQYCKDKPNVLRLIIKSSARFDNDEEWKYFISSLPQNVRRGESGDPALAYRLMLALGALISNVELSHDGSLGLSTTDGELLFIPGLEDVWEESWILEELKDVVGPDAKSFICDASGKVRFE